MFWAFSSSRPPEGEWSGAISVRPTASSGSPSARHKVPVEVHTPGSNRNVCAPRTGWAMHALWRAGDVRGTVHGTTAKGALMMLTERIWSGNSLRNFHYLIACSETGEALAVAPLEWRPCLEASRRPSL